MTDLEISRSTHWSPIVEIAGKIGILPQSLYPFGHYMAKVSTPPSELPPRKGKLVLVSAISPTPAGEGKTTTSIGLADALNRLGKNAALALREPSLGPVFGMKGGATGGGKAQVVPADDINLHFTGDFPAIEKAHNLLVALADNNLQLRRSNLGIDARTFRLKRVMDMNDRALRQIVMGLGGTAHGIPRQSGFDITAASEVMAILCLSKDSEDLQQRLGNILVAFAHDKQPVYARQLKAAPAMAALLQKAIWPNLVQSLEGTPAFIHGGPFANIAQGTNSLFATDMALRHADYVVTEAGFGFDLGGEKFLDIKCQAGGLKPDALVIVATVKALKYHGGVGVASLKEFDPAAVERGVANLEKHLENAALFGLRPLVALNHFTADHPEEIAVVEQACRKHKVGFALCRHWAEGGAGAEELARLVVGEAQKENHFRPLYEKQMTVTEKIGRIAARIYGAAEVTYAPEAYQSLTLVEKIGMQHASVCIAKTQYSFSSDPKLTGRAEGFSLHIRDIEIAAGAGFVVPLAGDIMRMPGLPAQPAAEQIYLDNKGMVQGIS